MGERVSNSASVSQGRIHGLDAFRGILMVLGSFCIPVMGTGLGTEAKEHSFSSHQLPRYSFVSNACLFTLQFLYLLWRKRGRKTCNRFDRLAVPLFGWLVCLSGPLSFGMHRHVWIR